MLRTTFSKKLSQKDEIVIQTNHNYFIRTAIATIAKILLAGVVTVGVVYLISLLGTATKADSGTLIFMLILTYIAYIVFFIVNVAGLVNLYNKSNEIESMLLGDRIVYKSKSTPTVIDTEYDDEI